MNLPFFKTKQLRSALYTRPERFQALSQIGVKPVHRYVYLIFQGKSKRYYKGKTRELVHAVKLQETWAIQIIGDFLAKQVHPGDILIPMPSRSGIATDTKTLSDYIAKKTGATVLDCLQTSPRESIYQTKNTGRSPKQVLLDFKLVCDIHPEKKVFIVDNVIGTGYSMHSAQKRLPFKTEPLVYAVDV